jgi:glycosyltransferase involved in cell wall biosynthesis
MVSETREENRPASGHPERVALVHDFLLDVRGGERVFLELCRMWPDADLFTAVYDEEGTEGRFSGRRVHSSFLQAFRPSARNFRALLPLYPAAIESLDLSGYDLVVSSSSAWAHAVLCGDTSVHVSYCHNPFRYAWSDRDRALAGRDPVTRWFLRSTFRRWRQWDWIAAQRTDRYVANSRTTQARIRSYFGRDADVVYPPVDTSRFSPTGEVGDHYLIVSELMAHKQIDLAIAAFNRLRLPLVVVGDGPQYKRLSRMAGPSVTFTGRLSDDEVAAMMASCRALVVTSVEEFGIAAVECQASGRPVIARRGGGALETIVDGVTGAFYSGGTSELAACVLGLDDEAVDPAACTENARRFDSHTFQRRMHQQISAAQTARDEHPSRQGPRSRRPHLPRREPHL